MDDIVILTGAGVSAESGLGTFRDIDGLWTKYDLEDVATPEGYARNPGLVHEFYNARRKNCRGAVPNASHHALARLAKANAGRVTLITQNIDDLHERGGSTDAIHMHGELMRALCAVCGHQWDWQGDMSRIDSCARCSAPGAVRPDVVWFGEMPYHMERIGGLLATAGLFVAIGTSGAVYPAAGFVMEARAAGARTLEINLEPSEVAQAFDECLLGPATETVPNWVERLLAT
ncbi:MAG: NAD-dependent deacylase [Pseudomonadota bacterium]